MHVSGVTSTDFTEKLSQCQKWSVPKVTCKKHKSSKLPAISTSNRFAGLSDVGVDTCSQSSNENPLSPLQSRHKVEVGSKTLKGGVTNLSKRMLTDVELSVLELGLTFCPSSKEINKDMVCEDFLKFIRHLNLREYFQNSPQNREEQEDDREPTGWLSSNPDWYPLEVSENRSESLKNFISDFKSDTKMALKASEKHFGIIFQKSNGKHCRI